MGRIFTKRIACLACARYFTITSAASKFCKTDECIRARRKAARLGYKQEAQRLAALVQPGSAAHLERATLSGE
jgi:hypothetical protein